MANYSLSKENVLQLTERFLTLAATLKEQPAVERIQPALEQYRLGLFRLVVIGEIKKGKSSFINALLGEPDLLPTLSDVATSTVYKLLYGDTRKFKVFFLPGEDGKTPDPLEIRQEQLAEYGTEDGNPNNEKRVDFIGVQLPHPLLKSGVVIIDTPGLGGLFRQHSEITWRYVPNADAIFFLFDSVEAVASKEEMDYLQKLRQLTSLVFFAQTKIDLVEPEKWQAWRDRNLTIISQTLEVPKEKLVYFPVSSELKKIADEEHSTADLNESGFIPLLNFFHNQLLASKEQRLANILLNQIAIEATGFHRRLSDEWQVFNTRTKVDLDTLERDFADTKTKFEKWRTTEYQQVVQAFQTQSGDLKRNLMDSLQNELDNSPHGPLIGPIIASVRESKLSAKQLDEEVASVQSICIDQCTQKIFAIQSEYNHKMEALIAAASQRLGRSYSVNVGTTVKGASVATVNSLNMHFSRFDEARNAMYGSSAGSMMAGIAASLLFPPAAPAFFITTFIGTLMGGWFASRDQSRRRQEEALIKLQGVLSDTVRLAQRQAIQQFQTTATEFERAASNAFESAASQVSQELQNRLLAITDARKRTREENTQKAATLKATLDQVDKLLIDLKQGIAYSTVL